MALLSKIITTIFIVCLPGLLITASATEHLDGRTKNIVKYVGVICLGFVALDVILLVCYLLIKIWA